MSNHHEEELARLRRELEAQDRVFAEVRDALANIGGEFLVDTELLAEFERVTEPPDAVPTRATSESHCFNGIRV
jgi:hypothetical protein